MIPSIAIVTCKHPHVSGFDPQPEDVKHNIDIGARVPPVDATKLDPVKLPQDSMPMLTPLQDLSEGTVPYIEAEFGELTASETARLVAKCVPLISL